MQKKVRKWFFVWDEAKEKAFLEEMALEGYRLVGVSFGEYIFEEMEQKRLVYQFDFKGFDRMKEPEYLQIFEDAGWDYMARFGRWYYFSREWSDEESDLYLFNDNESRRAMYKRLLVTLMIIGLPLYYQTFIFLPNMAADRLEFPSFYFFFRIGISIITILHIYALVRVFNIYRRLKSYLKE